MRGSGKRRAAVDLFVEGAQSPHSVTKNLELRHKLLRLLVRVLVVVAPHVDREELRAVNLVREVHEPDMNTSTRDADGNERAASESKDAGVALLQTSVR